MSTLLDRIIQLQEESGYSKHHIATELGLSNSAFTEWKKGKSKPSLDVVSRIALFFNVSIDYLVFGREHTTNLSTDDMELLHKYHSLPNENKQQLNTYLDAIIDTLSISSKNSKKLSS